MQIVYSDRHRLHTTTNDIPGCPFAFAEVPERAERIAGALRETFPDSIRGPIDAGMAPLLAVHTTDYLAYLQNAYALRQAYLNDGSPVVAESFAVRAARRRPTTYPGIAGWYAYDTTAPILEGTWQAAYDSAQCAITAADLVQGGERVAYALCRPPGHHASADLAGGYCYLNNAAIAARRLQERTGTRVAVLDIDYHHGNGTQEIFYQDPTVLYVSLHADTKQEYPFFWGSEEERGEGEGLGANINIPLPDETMDSEYLAALDRALNHLRVFSPEYLIVSAGFDLMEGDPEVLGLGFAVTTDGLCEIGKRISSLALPTVIVQEGGYNLPRLGEYAATFLLALV